MTDAVAIVGAGAAGAGVAHELGSADLDVTVFEKSHGVCGRAATRRTGGCVYDHGANYVKGGDDRVTELLTERLDTDGLVDIAEPVWVFDATGEIEPGDGLDDHKWTYEAGITQLGKRLFEAAGATVERQTRVEEIVRVDGGWKLRDDAGLHLGRFDAVVLTPPAPQTADLLGAANWEHRLARQLREAIAVVPYRTIVTAVLHYPFEIDWEYYALVNEDKRHDVGWVSNEACKPGHVPDDEGLLIAQMSPEWSVEHYEQGDAALTDAAADAVSGLLDNEELANPDWTDTQRWRYALPDEGVDDATLEPAAAYDLYFAGDWVAGEARVHAALRNGLETGEQLLADR